MVHYIKGSQVMIYYPCCISVPEYRFILANSAGPDEMPLSEAFQLGLHCLPK